MWILKQTDSIYKQILLDMQDQIETQIGAKTHLMTLIKYLVRKLSEHTSKMQIDLFFHTIDETISSVFSF